VSQNQFEAWFKKIIGRDFNKGVTADHLMNLTWHEATRHERQVAKLLK